MSAPRSEQEWILAYLDGKLDEQALASFEQCLIDSPALLDEVHVVIALRVGMRELLRSDRIGKVRPGSALQRGDSRPFGEDGNSFGRSRRVPESG
jgi:anti-sigma factor RsiW